MRRRLHVFAVTAALLVASGVAAQPGRALDRFETGKGISLPNGRLQLVSGSQGGAFFIDLDRVERKGDTVTFWTYGAYVPGNRIGNDVVVQDTALQVIDCAKRTIHTQGVSGFNEAGRFVVGLPASEVEPIEARSAHDFQARVLCDGAVLPPTNTLQGHAAALAVARAMLGAKAAPA